MRAAPAWKPQISFHNCQVFTHTPLHNHLSQVMDPPFPLSDNQLKKILNKLHFCPQSFFWVESYQWSFWTWEMLASWPRSHCQSSSVSVWHNLQQVQTASASATVTTCQKAKVLTGFHQPSVDTVVSRLELSSDYLEYLFINVKKPGVFQKPLAAHIWIWVRHPAICQQACQQLVLVRLGSDYWNPMWSTQTRH